MSTSTPTPTETAVILIRGLIVFTIFATILELCFGITGNVLYCLFPIWGSIALFVVAVVGALIYSIIYCTVIMVSAYINVVKALWRHKKASKPTLS